ncbi:MAG: hypothetical protein IJJ33_07155 [Victivallales bacterium]|nr:hypothetical protein [Victivallales bacterium]
MKYRVVIDVLAALAALLGAMACVGAVLRQRRLKGLALPPKVFFDPWQEIGLLLLFALGGEVFTSFFIRLPVVPPMMGCVLAILSSIGARNRLMARQNEADEPAPARQAVLRCHGLLCIGGCLLVFAALGRLACWLCSP